jgi:hypothetical protein
MATLYLSQNVFATIVAAKPSHLTTSRTEAITVIVLISAWMLWDLVHKPRYKRQRQWHSYDWKWRLFMPALWFGWLGLMLAHGSEMAFAGFLFLWGALCFGCMGSALFRQSPRFTRAAERLGWTILSFSLVISAIGVVISVSIPREVIPQHRPAMLTMLLFWGALCTTFVAFAAQKLYLHRIRNGHSLFDESVSAADPGMISIRTLQKMSGAVTSRDPSSDWVLLVGTAFIVLMVIFTSLHRNKVVTDVPVHLSAGALATIQARNHINQTATVCGTVVSIHYGGGGRTLVHLDKDWPHDVFTISIRAEDWNRFSPGPRSWEGKQVCVSGVIGLSFGIPDIQASSPGQISIK